MEIRLNGLGRRLHFSLEKVETVTGVNSKIDEDNHFLMWDFDNVPFAIVRASLLNVQNMFNLPEIAIVSTGKENNFHAYCFKSCSFRLARTILAATPNIDTHYLAVGLMRGYFTLRYTDMKGRGLAGAATLPSDIPATCSYHDVNSFVQYTKKVKV